MTDYAWITLVPRVFCILQVKLTYFFKTFSITWQQISCHDLHPNVLPTWLPVYVVNISNENVHKCNWWRCFWKGPINWCSNLTFIFEILKVSITFNSKKSINSFGDMVLYTPQFEHKNNQKSLFNCAERCWMLYHQQRRVIVQSN